MRKINKVHIVHTVPANITLHMIIIFEVVHLGYLLRYLKISKMSEISKPYLEVSQFSDHNISRDFRYGEIFFETSQDILD